MKTSCFGESCGECGFRSAVFNCLTPAQIEFLSEGKNLIKVARGTEITKQGQVVKSFIFLRSGLAKLSRYNPEGKEQIVGIARPKDFVGLLSLFSSKTHQYSVITVEDSEFCLIEFDRVMELINQNGKFALSLLEKISGVSDILISTRLNLNSRQLRGRIAFILCYFSNEVYASRKFNLPISRKEIGELIDMRVENVVRILSEFRRDGIISIEGTTIEVLNPEKLDWINQHG